MNSFKIKDRKVLVTGATGYVGQHIVNSLIEKGYRVYILTRRESPVFSNNKNINVIDISKITFDVKR